MSNPWIVLVGIAAVGVLFVILPVVGDAFLRFRRARALMCPEAGTDAEVGLDAGYAAWTAAFRTPRLRVKRCSLWPVRHGCTQSCLKLPAVAEEAEPVQPRAS